jgi:hypothetical protein
MKPLAKGNIGEIKFLLSLLNITRGLKPHSSDLEILPDFSTVDGPYKGKRYVIPSFFIKTVFFRLNLVKGLPK